MKGNPSDLPGSLDRPDPTIRFYLFHGPDDARSRANADRLVRGLAAHKFHLAGSAVRADPALLADEAGAIGLFGDRRALWIEPATDEIASAVEGLLSAPGVESAVIALSGSLKKSSALLKLAETSPRARAYVCYPLEGRDAERLVTELARGEGLRLRDDVAARVASSAGQNQAVIASELHKFALFLGAAPDQPRELEHDTIDRLGADYGNSDWQRIGDLALDGKLEALGDQLQRMPSGVDSIPIVRALQRRIVQLAQLRSRIEAGERLDGVLASLGKSLFWKDKPLMQRLLSQWTAARLEQLGSRVTLLERNLILSPAPAPATLAEELFTIARAARR